VTNLVDRDLSDAEKQNPYRAGEPMVYVPPESAYRGIGHHKIEPQNILPLSAKKSTLPEHLENDLQGMFKRPSPGAAPEQSIVAVESETEKLKANLGMLGNLGQRYVNELTGGTFEKVKGMMSVVPEHMVMNQGKINAMELMKNVQQAAHQMTPRLSTNQGYVPQFQQQQMQPMQPMTMQTMTPAQPLPMFAPNFQPAFAATIPQQR
jgi:hypothetical protein